jgi:hypothetical protein
MAPDNEDVSHRDFIGETNRYHRPFGEVPYPRV